MVAPEVRRNQRNHRSECLLGLLALGVQREGRALRATERQQGGDAGRVGLAAATGERDPRCSALDRLHQAGGVARIQSALMAHDHGCARHRLCSAPLRAIGIL